MPPRACWRSPVTVDEAAAALVPEDIKKDGKLTVAVSPFAPPLAVYATDNKTPVVDVTSISNKIKRSHSRVRGVSREQFRGPCEACCRAA
ncbi:hypothetical protein [Arthrobacter sp. ISL-65]|uniref:hypothetical protein n=1 Tax=Arthrobacter sp. ISL-65 TaxID=2819112 RepID=UPI0035A8464C